MIKVLYVHGYKGHPNGESSRLVKQKLTERGINCEIDAPSIPILEPEKARDYIREVGNKYDFIVASSMGAFYAMQQFGTYKVLVNPALPVTLENLKDENFEKGFITKIKKQEKDFFGKFKDIESIDETYFVFGKNDTVAKNRDFFLNRYRSFQIFDVDNMEHQMNEKGAEQVASIISNIINGEE